MAKPSAIQISVFHNLERKRENLKESKHFQGLNTLITSGLGRGRTPTPPSGTPPPADTKGRPFV